jgi:hypothetical protein
VAVLDPLGARQVQLLHEARVGAFPSCWQCAAADRVVYALPGKDLFYCEVCWRTFLAKQRGDWEQCRPTLTMANPPHCPKCQEPGPCFAEANVLGGSWFCRGCWGSALPEAALQFPPPLMPLPTSWHRFCHGLVASDYRFVHEAAGIAPTVQRNIAILRPGA